MSTVEERLTQLLDPSDLPPELTSNIERALAMNVSIFGYAKMQVIVPVIARWALSGDQVT